MLGITTAEEQSKVPCVSNLRIVGMPALAILTRGVYPPLARTVIICFPSAIETLLVIVPVGTGLAVFGAAICKAKYPRTRREAPRMRKNVVFIVALLC